MIVILTIHRLLNRSKSLNLWRQFSNCNSWRLFSFLNSHSLSSHHLTSKVRFMELLFNRCSSKRISSPHLRVYSVSLVLRSNWKSWPIILKAWCLWIMPMAVSNLFHFIHIIWVLFNNSNPTRILLLILVARSWLIIPVRNLFDIMQLLRCLFLDRNSSWKLWPIFEAWCLWIMPMAMFIGIGDNRNSAHPIRILIL